jgi:hypothetical protein
MYISKKDMRTYFTGMLKPVIGLKKTWDLLIWPNRLVNRLTGIILHYLMHPKYLQWEYHPENGVLNAFGYFQYRNFNHTLYEIYNMAHRYLYTLMLDNSGTWQVMGTDAEIKKAGTSDFIHEVIAVLNQHYTNARH